MATDRETAKRQRAEARKQRRKQSNESAGDDVPEAETPDEQPFESLKQAAKAAAATAALGAAVAAARALSNRNGSEGDDEARRQSDDEPEGEAQADELRRIADAAALAVKNGIEVHAGHGLTLANVAPIAAIPQIRELNIGHSLIADAIFVGLGDAVRAMRDAMDAAR